MNFVRVVAPSEVVSATSTASRPKLVASANKIVAAVRADEEKKLVAALQTIGVDWSAPPQVASAAKGNLDVAVTTTPSGMGVAVRR